MQKLLAKGNPVKEFDFNYWQLRNVLFRSKTEINLCGRASGKSYDIGYHSASMAHEMARGSFVFSGITYSYLLKYALPPIIAAWQQLGYIEGVHFILFKRPPKGFFLREPLVPVLRYDSVISWYTGAIFYLASQDAEVPFRGPSIDGVYLDEALTIDRIKFEEQILATNRGNRGKINHQLHHFFKVSSSKPIGTAGRWLLDYGNYYVQEDPKIPLIQRELVELKYELIDCLDPKRKKELWKRILQLKRLINYHPIKTGDGNEQLFYSEADAFDNKHVEFGFFRDNKKRMSPVRYRVELLNETITQVEYGFYPAFSQHTHVRFDTIDYSGFDPEHYKPGEYKDNSTWIKDKDVVKTLPLRLSCDWGASITFLSVYQRLPKEIRILKNLYVKHPKILDDVFTEFCDYYSSYPIKHVYFWFDHTGNKRNPNSKFTYAEQAANVLRSKGWIVTLMSKGAAPTHEKKYVLINRVLREEESKYPIVRINGNNCKELITSIELAPVKLGSKEIEKDKSSETDSEFPQEEATHGSDTFDIIINAEASIDIVPDFIPNIIR